MTEIEVGDRVIFIGPGDPKYVGKIGTVLVINDEFMNHGCKVQFLFNNFVGCTQPRLELVLLEKLARV